MIDRDRIIAAVDDLIDAKEGICIALLGAREHNVTIARDELLEIIDEELNK